MERYQRVFGVDQEYENEESRMVGDLARRLLRCMVGHSAFLRFKTSQMAAAALMLAMNILQSPIALRLGLPVRLPNIYAKSAFSEVAGVPDEEVSKCPLRYWNAGVRRLTSKCVGKDIKPCYKVLIKLANEMEFERKLSADKSLFPLA